MEAGNELLEEAFRMRLRTFGETLHLYYPSFSYYTPPILGGKRRDFPSFSITGERCTLNCIHCKGKLLQSMIPAVTPQTLKDYCLQIYKKGGGGCLISGGCTSQGSVPLDRFIETFREVKRETDLRVVVHTGLASKETLTNLSKAGVDVVSLDVIGSDTVIREIYQLNLSTHTYEETMRHMRSLGLPVVPHILVGLYHGEITGEKQAVEMAVKYDPAALVFIVFTPFKGTPMEKDPPPPLKEVVDLIASTRIETEDVPLVLGCVRPKRQYRNELDRWALQAGVNGIAYPSENVYAESRRLGLKPILHDTCCSLIYQDIQRRQ